MPSFIANLKDRTQGNSNYREVLFSGPNSQLVVMSLKPQEEIGMEVHEDNDQFIYIEKGEGKVVIEDNNQIIRPGHGVFIAAGSRHNIINTSETEDLKLFTLYAPPHHAPGTVHETKESEEKS